MTSETKDLDSLYKKLEEKIVTHRYLIEIAQEFQKVRDILHKEGKSDEEIKAQWEMNVFNFSIESNLAKPLFTMTNEKGEEISYPNFADFNDKAYEYIAGRIDSTNNPLLKARYAHIMWISPKKHAKFALTAIDSYMELVKIFEDSDKREPDALFGLEVINSIKNAFILATNVADSKRIDATKEKVKSLIANFNPTSNCLYALRANLIDFMLKNGKFFGNMDFQGLSVLCLDYAKELKDPHQSITFLELGGRIDQKLGTSTANWKQLIAEHYEQLMNAHIKSNKLVAVHFCEQALKYYREINNQDKIAELEKIYGTIKDQVELKEISVPIDLTEYMKKCEITAKKIVSHSSEDIIKFLISEPSLFPKLGETEKLATEISKGHIASVIPQTLLDERGHVEQRFETEEELKFLQTLQQYDRTMQIQSMPFINMIIIEAVKAKKLDFVSIMDFFKKYAWFGKTLTRKSQNQDAEYNWLNLVAPALQEYFSQIDYLLTTGRRPNFVLGLDSLALKIEGLLRDLCNYTGVVTFVQRNGNKGRVIYREKDLTALLHDDKLKGLMGIDDLFLLRFVLIEKAGYNLRHRTAHSLMLFEEYSLFYMNLLIMILLRISKFSFQEAATQDVIGSKSS